MNIQPISYNININKKHATQQVGHDNQVTFKKSEKVTADDSDLTLTKIVSTAIGIFSFVFLAIYGFRKLSNLYSKIAKK